MKTKLILLILVATVVYGQVNIANVVGKKYIINILEPDTIEATLLVPEEVFLLKPHSTNADMKLQKVIVLVDRYDFWRAAKPVYLDANRKPIKALDSVARMK